MTSEFRNDDDGTIWSEPGWRKKEAPPTPPIKDKTQGPKKEPKKDTPKVPAQQPVKGRPKWVPDAPDTCPY